MQEKLNSKYSLEWLLSYAANHTRAIPDEIKPHLHRLLSAPAEFDQCPLTRSATAELVSLCSGTLSVKATIGDYSLPFHRSGRNVRYKLGDIKAYLANNSYRATREAVA